MAEHISENAQQKIAQRLGFYQDLGIAPFYRDRHTDNGPHPQITSLILPATASPSVIIEEDITLARTSSKPSLQKASSSIFAPPSPKLPVPLGTPAPSLFESLVKISGDTLPKIREDLGECTRCKLHTGRNKLVFADGNPQAGLVFVGEGPGRDEDMQGLPFVGRAGKLLNQMIEAMGLRRQDVYICNVVKCRPPENRTPERDEVATCSPFLLRQLDVISPKVIVCLGSVAAQTLLETNRGISQFRGQWQEFRGTKLLATYHPAYLLRNPSAKGEVWKDLQKVMAVLGLEVKKGKSA